MSDELRIQRLEDPEAAALDALLAERIHAFNVAATGHGDGRLLGLSLRDASGEVVAGLSGHTWGGCCELTHLWVREDCRGQGFGARLVRTAEEEARRRGCAQVVLLTHSFQAPGFYEKLGYERRYEVQGRPQGHSNIVFVKPILR